MDIKLTATYRDMRDEMHGLVAQLKAGNIDTARAKALCEQSAALIKAQRRTIQKEIDKLRGMK